MSIFFNKTERSKQGDPNAPKRWDPVIMIMQHSKFRIITAFCLLSAVSVYGQINIDDSIRAILNTDTLTHETRFRNAINLMFYHAAPNEAETLGMDVIYPFVQKTWKNQSEQLARLSRLYTIIGFCYRERGGSDRNEREQLFTEKSLEAALQSGNDTVCARSFTASGFTEMKRGDVKRAHDHLYRAITHYDRIGNYVKSSEMLYVIVSNFFEIKDMNGMRRVLLQMEEYLEKDKSKQSLYQYGVIKKSYYELLIEKEKTAGGTVNYTLADSVMHYVRRNIALVENSLEELDPHWMHGYAYWYLAKAFDEYYPEQTDSIFHNLDMASAMIEKEWRSRTNEWNAVLELKIYIAQIRTSALARLGKTQQAYLSMSGALAMLDSLKGYRNVNEERYKAYLFMADYYEKAGQAAQSLAYHKLLRESEAERYETEKVQAINDMSAKYEAEKKEFKIQTLTAEKRAVQHIAWLLTGLLLALIGATVLLIRANRLKRKNAEQQLYETALLAELRQNELEKIRTAQQQIEQSPVQNTVDHIAQMVSANQFISREAKQSYLERLPQIDLKLLEQIYCISETKITAMDMKYTACFAAGMDAKDISMLFNIEPASVHTVRYRIRKKLPKNGAFGVILQ
ncbi:MAG: hypothetical protein LBV41_10660 [Cytophagaceae bacterium]|jgi:hypothetical protein|nr:hypothetical protein [Cytophagaceae bacterium]